MTDNPKSTKPSLFYISPQNGVCCRALLAASVIYLLSLGICLFNGGKRESNKHLQGMALTSSLLSECHLNAFKSLLKLFLNERSLYLVSLSGLSVWSLSRLFLVSFSSLSRLFLISLVSLMSPSCLCLVSLFSPFYHPLISIFVLCQLLWFPIIHSLLSLSLFLDSLLSFLSSVLALYPFCF